MIQRTEPLFWKNNSKNWTWLKDLNSLFFKLDSKNWTYFDDSQTWSFFLELWHKEFFFWKKKNDSKNWTKIFDSKKCFFCMAQRNDFLYGSKNWFFVWLKELKPFSLNMTQRIETFFFEYDAENWCLFLFLPQRIETFSSLPQMIELFFFKNFIDSKNWTFFSDMTQRNEIRKKKKRLKELNLFFWNMTYRIEPLLFSLIWFKELNFVSKKKTQKIEIFFFNNDSKDWTLCKRLIELSLFYEPLLNLILFFFFYWLKELNLLRM